ncbi:MAG: multidrug efflux RND transporter permease subunit [Gemmataceae bacterium]
MISHFFIDRPIFASVLSIIITIAGIVSVLSLPVAQYPDITPPTVQVSAYFPGANARTVMETVAQPIEQQVSGVENAIYMTSQCTNDGRYNLMVTFKLGVDPNMAQVLTQNRVQLALPNIPDLVQREGVSVLKMSPSVMMIVNLVSRVDEATGKPIYDDIYLSNYATIQIRDELLRLPGIANVTFMGQRDYSMRVWLNPEKMAVLGISTQEIIQALNEQNVQVAAGSIGQQPVPRGQQFQLIINTLGRLTTLQEFGNIIIKVGGMPDQAAQEAKPTPAPTASPSIVRLRDIARVELGAMQYDQACTLDGQPSVALSIYQLPGSNALATAQGVYKKMTELRQRFPDGLDYKIVYDTTPFIQESIFEVFITLGDAIFLVAIVVLVFLQNWRATVIPLIAVPVAIVGTFAVMAAVGFSLNNLSLFGLVLAIGIVVDDAIVVVENVERWLEEGHPPREAARKAMNEVTGPVVAVALVLCAVFVPCAFISGITGQFFRQFAITIAVSTVISAFNSLTLSPALAALLLRHRKHGFDWETLGSFMVLFSAASVWVRYTHGLGDHLPIVAVALLGALAGGLVGGATLAVFNRIFDVLTAVYTGAVGVILRLSLIVLIGYGGLLYLTYHNFTTTPTGFIPPQDKGYLLVNVQLPDSSSVQRTQEVLTRIDRIVRGVEGDRQRYPGLDGVRHTVAISGQSLLLAANAPNLGSMNVMLQPFEERRGGGLTADDIAQKIRDQCSREIREAIVTVSGAPPIDGLGTAGGFKLMVEDRGPLGLATLQSTCDAIVVSGAGTPGLRGLFTSSRNDTPWLFLDIDRDKCLAMGVSLESVFNALQVYLGSYYVNQFNEFGRIWQVNLQADNRYRDRIEDIRQMKVRNKRGEMVPLATMAAVRDTSGPVLLMRHNMYSAAAVYGDATRGTSSGQAIDLMEGIVRKHLPPAMDFEWTELTFMQLQAGSTAMVVFALAVVFVFLVLAAQYESWSLPLAVILVVPMCLLCSVIGVILAQMDINIFTQIGFVVLVGLAGKNAILIVEFAKQQFEGGMELRKATLEACRLRLRPILMTSFAFILGVVPLVIAEGAGAEMRQALGVAVFAGMLGVTGFGVLLTPVFFLVIMWLSSKPRSASPVPTPATESAGATGITEHPQPKH